MKSFFIGNIEIKVPVIQGGMGVGISLSGLASAVANEGGVGVISCAGLGLLYPKEKGTYTEKCISGLKEEIRKSRMKTKGIIGVMSWLPYRIMLIWCVLRLMKRLM